MISIIGVCIDDRIEEAVKFQHLITSHGCKIRTRIGLHAEGEYGCSNKGIILLEVVDKVNEIYDALSKEWNVQIMKF